MKILKMIEKISENFWSWSFADSKSANIIILEPGVTSELPSLKLKLSDQFIPIKKLFWTELYTQIKN